jgi:hypothetical protein
VDIYAAAAAVVDQLVAAGVRATLDGRDLNPPAVLVRPPTVTYRFGRGGDADWEAWAVVGDLGSRQALDALSTLLEAVSAALVRPVQARPDVISGADGSTVPAYVLTWSGKIPATSKETRHA